MKKVVLSLIAVGLLSFSCSQEKKTEANESSKQAQKEVMKSGVSEVNSEQLKSILSSYFNVKNALVKTDASEAKSALAKLLESVGSEMEKMKNLAQEMQQKDDVEEIRSNFDDLSQEVYVLVKENSENKDQKVYKQFCPMAFNNNGAFWLSEQKEIRNPYFGDKMLKCGKVQEEL